MEKKKNTMLGKAMTLAKKQNILELVENSN